MIIFTHHTLKLEADTITVSGRGKGLKFACIGDSNFQLESISMKIIIYTFFEWLITNFKSYFQNFLALLIRLHKTERSFEMS